MSIIDLTIDLPLFVAATGHRPHKLGDYSHPKLIRLAMRVLRKVDNPVVSGMARGWDTAWAQAALALGLPLTAAVPFPDQDDGWRIDDRRLYRHILERCVKVEIVRPSYELGAYQRRNEWMVDRSHRVIALHDGSRGGTFNCIAYANRRGVPVTNVWEEWKAIA